jgi:hypothetical protein
MKDLWRDFWTREPSELEKDLISKGFTQPQASNLIDLRLRFEYGRFEDDGGPAPRADDNHSDRAA